MDASREDLRRVSVDTIQDWQRIRINFRQAVESILHEHLAANGVVPEKDVFLAHVNQFVDSTFGIAESNLRVNGRNCEELDQNEQDMEPFDEALDRRIWSLADHRLNWNREIAGTRRTRPKEIETTLRELLDAQRAVDVEDASPTIQQVELEEDIETEKLLERYALMEDVFQKTTAIGELLKQAVPNQEERTGRVKVVEAEIKGLKP